MSENKSLIIIPNFIDSFDKKVRIVTLKNTLNLRCHIKMNEFPYVKSDFLIDKSLLIDGWFRTGYGKVINGTDYKEKCTLVMSYDSTSSLYGFQLICRSIIS